MALFALGFRPLYLLAGLYAALGVPLWALQYSGRLPAGNMLWHAHEMLFGYAFAVIAGFLLTAVRAWPGGPRPRALRSARSRPSGCWRAWWDCTRCLLSSLIDAAFALGVAWGIGRPILASGNRNWFFILLVLALGAASVAFQAYPQVALAAGLDVVLLVIAIMGGRVIPGFTNNAVIGAGARRNKWIEHGALGSVLLILVLDLLVVPVWPVALAAAAIHAARLALWAPLATRGRPILWILHLSYAWVVVHLALRARRPRPRQSGPRHACAHRRGDRRPHPGHDDAHFARAYRAAAAGGRGKPLRTSWCTWPRSCGCCCPSCSRNPTSR